MSTNLHSEEELMMNDTQQADVLTNIVIDNI